MSAMVTVGLVGLLTIFGLMGISNTRQATQQVLSERVTLARLSANTLDSSLRQIQSVLILVGSRNIFRETQAPLSERQAALDTAYQEIENFSHGISLLNPEGELVTSSTGVEQEIDWKHVPAVQAVLSRKDPTPQLSIVPGGHPQAVVAVPVFAESGQSAGVLAALLDFSNSSLFPFARPFNLGQTGAVDVIDSQGVVLLSSNPDLALKAEDLEKFLSHLFVAGVPVVETCLGCYGENYPNAGDEVIAFSPLTQAPWGVVVRQKAAEAFAPVRNLMVRILILSLATVAGALGLVWVTTSSVIQPVQLLTGAARRITDGDLATPIELPLEGSPRKDEIGALSESFIRMRQRLKHSMEEIQAWNQELDARVQERTQALRISQLEAQAARDDLRAVIDALSDELIVINVGDYCIQQVNQVARLRHPELRESDGTRCYHLEGKEQPCKSPSHVCPIRKVLWTGESTKVTHILDCQDQDRRCFTEIVASPMRDASGEITRIVELKRNVTEEITLKESLVRRNQQLSILNAVANTVNQSLNLKDILGRALDEVLQLTEIDIGAIFLQEDPTGSLQLMAHRGISEEAARIAAQFGLLDGSCGGVLETGQLTIVPDLTRLRTKRARSLQKEKLSTLVHVPLTAKGCTLGSMCVGTRQSREFDLEEQELLTAIGNQIAVAIENARLYAEVQHKEHVRGELFKKAIGAQEEERKRIARELHDDTSQALAALLFAAEEGLEMNDPAEVNQRLERMRDLAQRTLDGVHKIIFDLRPSMLDHLGLVPALRWLASSRLESKGMRVVIEEASTPRRLPAEVETAIFRAVQEAISNIARHSGARNVSILFRFDDENTQVSVEDDGIGFDVDELTLFPDSARGLGLLSMRERVELLGGDLEVDSSLGGGTRIYIRVPIANRRWVFA
jgi:signal transduction histidine kinase/HAMP domain-containing protein